MKKGTFHLKAKDEINPEALMEIFTFDTPYQVDRMSRFIRESKGKNIKVEITPVSRPKSRESLGFYFGALVTATAMDTLSLSYDSEKIYQDYTYYRQNKKIGQRDLDIADEMLRLEWHYNYTRRIDGKSHRIPKALADQDNAAMLALIEKVMEWRTENGYPYIDIEKYKLERDRPKLHTDEPIASNK